MAASDAGEEAIFLSNFFGELGFPQQSVTPIFTDSTGAQAIINKSYERACIKHIAIHYHSVQQHVAGGRLDYQRVKSSDKSSDVRKKPLPHTAHSYFFFMMDLNMSASNALDHSHFWPLAGVV